MGPVPRLKNGAPHCKRIQRTGAIETGAPPAPLAPMKCTSAPPGTTRVRPDTPLLPPSQDAIVGAPHEAIWRLFDKSRLKKGHP